MFSKLSLLAVVLPLVHALTLNAPTDAVSTQQSTITFSGTDSDPVFTIELNHPSLLSRIAIANNVNPGDGQVTVIWPTLTETTGYTLEAVNITNINDVFATSGAFNIAAPPSFSASGTPSSVSATATNPPSGSATTAPATTRSSAAGTSGTSAGTSAGTQSSPSSASASPTQINGNGAFSVKSSVGAVALAAIGAVFAL